MHRWDLGEKLLRARSTELQTTYEIVLVQEII